MDIVSQTEKKMQQALDHLKDDLKSVRTGHANPSMLDNVSVEVYGSFMRIRDLASVSAPEPRQLLITPFDPSTKDAIGKGIEKANIGVRPIVEGNVVRITIAPMDESQRKNMIKICHEKKENAKVSIRNIRRDSNELVRKQKQDSVITEDLMKKFEKNIQDLTDKYCKTADDITAAKEKEVSTI